MSPVPPTGLDATSLELLPLEMGLGVLDEEGRYLFVNPVLARLHGRPAGRAGDDRFAEMICDPNDIVLRGVVERVRTAGAPVRGDSITYDGRSWDVSYVPIEVAGRFAVGVVATDAYERDVVLAEAKSSASRHAALAEYSFMAVLAEDLKPLFDEAVALLVRELDLEFAALLELLPGGVQFAIRAQVGYRLPEDAILAGGAASQEGYTLTSPEPVIVEDLAAELRFSPSAIFVQSGVRSGISVSIRAGAVVWGVLEAHTTHPRTFAPDHVNVLRTVANVLGAALAREATTLELKTLALQRRRLTQEALESRDRERRRLADLVHDDVLQHLLFARQECAALANVATEPAVARLRQSLDEATKLLRDAVSDLHPVTLARVGLRSTLTSLAREYAERGGLEVSVRVAENCPALHDQLVVSAVRELLTNAVKHARASAVDVVVQATDAELDVEVSDDGVGLDPLVLRQSVAAGHIGLASLIERFEALGGRGHLETAWNGRGTRVRLALPLP